MKPALLLSCLLISACAAAPASRSDAAKSPGMIAAADPFPVPKSGMTIPGSDKTPLLDLIAEFERVTGVRVIFQADTRAQLSKVTTGLMQPLEVPAARVYSTFETVLVQNDFVMSLVQSEPPIMVAIAGSAPGGRGAGTMVASPTDLEMVSRHPALLASVVLTLPHVSVRDMSNSLRQVFQDPQRQQIIPIGNSDSVLISGRGSEVAAIARMLLAIEESEARSQAEDAKRAVPSGSAKQDEPSPK